jgi:hypothetical protein
LYISKIDSDTNGLDTTRIKTLLNSQQCKSTISGRQLKAENLSEIPLVPQALRMVEPE